MITGGRSDRSWILALAVYLAVAVVMTWPLVLGLGRDVPGDLGDALLNMWILGWGAEQVPRLLTGQASLQEYWNANIFHPAPLALAFSEHLFGLVIQGLAVYHLTGNLILTYNLLFLSTFALSGVGMFLLSRDLLRDLFPANAEEGTTAPWIAAGAFVAGLLYAFVPMRVAQVAHIQSLSSQWMPLALYGLRRFLVSGRPRALAGGSAALVMQNWSCGYYLIFFAPFVPLFVAHQMWTARQLRNWRRWLALAGAGALVAAATWPFLSLYLRAREIHGFERTRGEVVRFSADVYSYLTAPDALRVWGGVLQPFPKPEGELFFGAMMLLLALAGVLAVAARVRRTSTAEETTVRSPLRRAAAWTAGVALTVQAVGFAALIFTGGFITSIAGVPLRATNAFRLITGIVVAAAALLALSPRIRRGAIALARSSIVFSMLLAGLAIWLSLGPLPQSRGETLQGLGLYALLYDHVPGFDGLRVPARYAMVAAVFLSIVAGAGAAAVLRASSRLPVAATALVGLVLVDLWFAPLPTNQTWAGGDVTPPARVQPADDAPAVYHVLASLPDDIVVAEFPFGDPAWELRYVYYSTVHWKPLVNGYSGAFPREYQTTLARLQRLGTDPEAAWQALKAAGTTHVVVHAAAFPPGGADVVMRWLTDHFAVEIARFGDDVLFEMGGPRRSRPQA